VTPPKETASRFDEAIGCFERAVEALRQIPRGGDAGVRVDGIEHGLLALAERLQSLRDDVAGDGDRTA
jgi:hypothetical protein